jgi:hypothetical protein
MFQIKCLCDCDYENEYLIETKEVLEELERAFEIISKYQPDISLFPEMSYVEKYEKRYMEASKEKIIIAGSYYKNGINTTVVFENGKKKEILKRYASGAEPMARKISFMEVDAFIEEYLSEHEFWINGNKIYILNCMEYYHAAYYIARNPRIKEDLFGIFAICSNSNTRVFEEDTVVTHNHNEDLYTFSNPGYYDIKVTDNANNQICYTIKIEK